MVKMNIADGRVVSNFIVQSLKDEDITFMVMVIILEAFVMFMI